MRAGRSHSGFGPAPVHGRGATFVAVASSRPNSARRVATPPWVDSDRLRHSCFTCRCPRCGPDIRGRFTCAPPRQDVCLPRLARLSMSGFGKKMWSRPRRQHHAHRDPPFVSASARGLCPLAWSAEFRSALSSPPDSLVFPPGAGSTALSPHGPQARSDGQRNLRFLTT